MVIHDTDRQQEWVTQQQQKRQRKPEKKKRNRLSVTAVQSLACCCLLLVVLLFRLAGGEAYNRLRQGFHQAMQGNEWLAALATLWDGDPLEESSHPETGDKVDNFTPSSALGRLPPAGALSVGLRVSHPATAPLSQGRISSSYGYRSDPTGGGEQFHRGVDIAAPEGTPLAAIYNGTVAATGENNSLGRYIRIDHGDGVEILYAHCLEVTATEGMRVRAGERVAAVGSTGDSTGPHVHIQVTADGVVYNPADTVPLTRYA